MNKGIKIENLSYRYHNGEPLLKNINLSIEPNSFLGITGTNGSGKTTLSLLLNGLIPHEISGKMTGDVFIDGINTKKESVAFFARKVGMLFQNPDFMLFNMSVREEIEFGLKNFGIKDTDEIIASSLKTAGLEGFEKRDPNTLSLGEKQKVALACVLALNTEYIVLDEPAAMLDYRSALNLYKLLSQLHQFHGKTIIVVEHDTDFLFNFAKKVILIDSGEIIHEGDTDYFFKNRKLLSQKGIKIPGNL